MDKRTNGSTYKLRKENLECWRSRESKSEINEVINECWRRIRLEKTNWIKESPQEWFEINGRNGKELDEIKKIKIKRNR